MTPTRVDIPALLMDDIFEDRISLSGSTVRLREARAAAGQPNESNVRFANSLVQRLNTQLHGWKHNTVFSIDALREDTGWEPEFTFASAVEHTYEWFRRDGLEQGRQYEWSWEDQIRGMIRK